MSCPSSSPPKDSKIPFGTGIIYGREYIIARDLVRKLHVGDSVTAKVVEIVPAEIVTVEADPAV